MVENIEVINETLGLDLSGAENEQDAGTFKIDILAEDSNGEPVIIENQLGKSDHDHLGKVITYLTAVEAKTAIWIVADPRPEHVKAISWLNESSSASFYLLKIEAIKIGNSEPAPLLTLIVGPSDEVRNIGRKKKELSERHIIREKWWTQLLEISNSKTKLHSNRNPNGSNWIGSSSGKGGLIYYYNVRIQESSVGLVIDRGKDCENINDEIFNFLIKERKKIEKKFGSELDWVNTEGVRLCYISKPFEGGYRSPEEEWPEIHERLTDAMVRFEKAFKPHIKKLNI